MQHRLRFVPLRRAQIGFQQRILKHLPLGIAAANSHHLVLPGLQQPCAALVIAVAVGSDGLGQYRNHLTGRHPAFIDACPQAVHQRGERAVIAGGGKGKRAVQIGEGDTGTDKCRPGKAGHRLPPFGAGGSGVDIAAPQQRRRIGHGDDGRTQGLSRTKIGVVAVEGMGVVATGDIKEAGVPGEMTEELPVARVAGQPAIDKRASAAHIAGLVGNVRRGVGGVSGTRL